MKARLELKPQFQSKPKTEINHTLEKLNRFLKNVRFFFGHRPELELGREDLNPSQSLNDVRKKTSLNADNQDDPEKDLSATDRFVDGAVDFLSAFGMIMAGDISYDPDAAPAPEPAPEQNQKPQSKPDPLAWKKKKNPPAPLSAQRLSFLKNMSSRPMPTPAPAKKNDNQLEQLNRLRRPRRPSPFPT